MKNFLCIALIALWASTALAQDGYDNPCLWIPGCQNSGGIKVLHDPGPTMVDGQTYKILIAAGDLFGKIDTSYSGIVSLTAVSNTGILSGTLGKSFSKYTYLDIRVDHLIPNLFTQTIDTFEVAIDLSGIGRDTISLYVYDINMQVVCMSSPSGCQNGGGNKIQAQAGPNVIVVDVVFGYGIYIVDSINNKIDTSYSGEVKLKKISGPGNFNGHLSIGGKGYTAYDNLKFDEMGIYDIEISAYNAGKDTVTFVVSPTGIKEYTTSPLNLFPNPSEGNVKLQWGNISDKIKNVEVYTFFGQKIYSRVHTDELIEIDLKNFPEGTYFVQVYSGERFTTGKLVLIK